MNKRAVGSEKEVLAVRHLSDKGYNIVTQNYRCKLGEVDIVAKDGDYLVFAEVKYRKDDSFGLPAEAVTVRKQIKIRQTAQIYMSDNQYPANTAVRFDVVSILGDCITVIQDAF